jgi:hypothetical protein
LAGRIAQDEKIRAIAKARGAESEAYRLVRHLQDMGAPASLIETAQDALTRLQTVTTGLHRMGAQ